MSDLTSKKKPLNFSILNTIIENTVKSNANSGFNKDDPTRQTLTSNSFREFTNSYRNHNINLSSVNKAREIQLPHSFNTNSRLTQEQPPRLILGQYETNIDANKKQKFKFKMKLFRSPNASFKDFIPCLCLWFLLLSVTGIYFGLVWPRLIDIFNVNSYWIIFLVFKCFFLFNLVVNFLLSIFKDPGRLPMNKNNHLNVNSNKSELIAYVKGEAVELKWCTVSLKSFILIKALMF